MTMNARLAKDESWRWDLWNSDALKELGEDRWQVIFHELQNPQDYSGENNGFYGHQHTEEWKKATSERTKGENNPMYGTKRGIECSNGGLFGEANGMHGTKRGGECANKRLTCPICGMESNSTNIKRHITKTHKLDWKTCLY